MDNQNTKQKEQRDTLSCVLILVLMDNQNTDFWRFIPALIAVLILVLMDNQNTFWVELSANMTFCLNPCSNG